MTQDPVVATKGGHLAKVFLLLLIAPPPTPHPARPIANQPHTFTQLLHSTTATVQFRHRLAGQKANNLMM